MNYLIITNLALLAYIIWKEWMFKSERDELTQKIMAKDYSEYRIYKDIGKNVKTEFPKNEKKELYKDPYEEPLTEDEIEKLSLKK